MLEKQLTPAMRAARDRVAVALDDEAIAPSLDWHEAECGCDPENPECQAVPPAEGQFLLSEWVVILAWTHAETGETWYTRLPSQNQSTHGRVGLLTMGLDGFSD